MTLPLPLTGTAGGLPFPFYFVPTQTSQISASLSSPFAPVNFDVSYTLNNFGDPDLEGAPSGNAPSVTFSAPEVTPGLWQIDPSEVGPYPATGAPTVTGVAATFNAVVKNFDLAITSSTGDLWLTLESTAVTPPPTTVVYVPAGATATITVTITPNGTVGQTVSGTLYVDDLTIDGSFGPGLFLPNIDEVAAFPYSYTIN